MSFPGIEDRLFSQSKNSVLFMAKTTQNELIANPSPLSSHRKLNSVVRLLRRPMHACLCASCASTTHNV